MARTDDGVKPRNDAYTGLLAISFLALVGGAALMAMDANELGKPPGKLAIDVPGVTPGKAGEGLRRPDAGAKIDTNEPAPKAPDPMPKMPDPGMSKAEPGKLPNINGDAAKTIVPVKHEKPADGPPLPVKPFVPPM